MKTNIVELTATPGGRVARVVLGLAIIGIGLSLGSTTARTILVIVGLLPILAGTLNFCGIAPLFGKSFSGKEVLKQKHV
ncbi:MAG: DUF2892 domain-containing protein [Firmicutes bacterium]|nr:DUF2892 domain-containing protein [Bacillota bacterium]